MAQLSSLTILMICIITIVFTLFISVFFYWVYIYTLQKKENQILIRINKVKSNQAIKREKYINTITTRDDKLNSIVKFLKNSIQTYEKQLKITEKNILLLRNIKKTSNFREYHKKINTINFDLNILEKKISSIDNSAIDSKAFKESSLSLLIHIRRVFVELENFYIFHLLPNKFINQPIYDLIINIKDDLTEISDSISTVYKDDLIEKFTNIIEKIEVFAIWTIKSYSTFQKLLKIKETFANTLEIKNEQNLHFAYSESDEVDKLTNFINENISNSENKLKNGDLSESEPLVNEMMSRVILLSIKINLVAEQESLLNNSFLKEEILKKTDWMLSEFRTWSLSVIQKWANEFENTYHDVYINCLQIFDNLNALAKTKNELNNFKMEIMEKTNYELLSQSTKISYSLINLSESISNTSKEIIYADKNNKEIIQKILKLNIFIPQLINYAQFLIDIKSDDFLKLKNMNDKVNKLVEESVKGYDYLTPLEKEIEEIYQLFLINKKIIHQKLKEKLLAEKLYKYWKASSLRLSSINPEINEKIFESLKTRKWSQSIDLIIDEIYKLEAEISQIENSKVNKKGIFKFLNLKT